MISSSITLALEVLGFLPDLIAAGRDVSAAVAAIKAIHEDPAAPSEARWNELDAAVAANKAAFEAAAKD